MKKLLLGLACLTTSCVGYEDTINDAIQVGQQVGQAALAPSPAESVSATRQALEKGVSVGVNLLQKDGGFSQSVHRILIPNELQKAAQLARNAGLGGQVDTFEKSLNRAAEQAMASAMPIFKNAITKLTFQDIVGILTGPDQAATQYFRRTSEQQLLDTFKPIVAKATQQNNVGKYYTQIATAIRPAAALAGVPIATVNLDEYVSQKASQALFVEIGRQEKLIRENPVERSTALLQKVFGYYANRKS
ncbi:MAG TPA: DUF4197 domain-containing protein [Oligoflexus sp.]|uniref:DUF4197 domain-containing protein n=1 Tax=Oligoflexus sp. TaxID=1971216 RepID=UPI002D8005D2|nr:DUF4197 domain-containing protein [Oligoflexus sp.]HET9237510.1 DUF4197 domain-containing protein [Oligoflexus sp.]